MNDLSFAPVHADYMDIVRHARAMRAEALSRAGRKTWTRLSGLIRH